MLSREQGVLGQWKQHIVVNLSIFKGYVNRVVVWNREGNKWVRRACKMENQYGKGMLGEAFRSVEMDGQKCILSSFLFQSLPCFIPVPC